MADNSSLHMHFGLWWILLGPLLLCIRAAAICEKAMHLVAAPDQDGKRCGKEAFGTPGAEDRLFELRGAAATIEACGKACGDNSACVAWSGMLNDWCHGCRVPMTEAANKMAVGYKKVWIYKDSDKGSVAVVQVDFVGADGGEVSAQVLCGDDAASAAGRIATARSTRATDGGTVMDLAKQLQAKLDEQAEPKYKPPDVLDSGTERERPRVLKTGGLYSRRAGEHAKKKEYALAVSDLVRALLRPNLDPTAQDRLSATLEDFLNKAEAHRAEMAKDGDLSELFEDLTLVDDSSANKDVDLKKLKRLYRDLSVKYHPDKNEAAAKRFNRIRDAYEVLSDPMKTMLYDTGGIESVRKYEGGGGDLERTDNSERQMWITLEEAYKGTVKKVEHGRRIVCRSCRLHPDLPRCKKCQRCPGEKEMRVRWLNQHQYTHEEHEIPSKEKCQRVEEVIDINIERGMGVGERVNFPHMANQLPKQIAGDFQVSVWIKDHNRFKRVGNDLIVVVHVTLFEALLGFQRELKHLDGHVVKYGMDRGTVLKPGQALQIEGEGMPLREDATSFGKLIIQFKMDFPDAIPLEAADSLESHIVKLGLISEDEAKKAKRSRNEL